MAAGGVKRTMTNLDRSKKVVEAFNGRNFSYIISVLSPDFQWYDSVYGTFNKETFPAYLSKWVEGLSDATISETSYHAVDDNRIYIEFTGKGTHSGNLLGIKATHKPVIFNGILVHMWDKNGLLLKAKTYYDSGKILQNLSSSG